MSFASQRIQGSHPIHQRLVSAAGLGVVTVAVERDAATYAGDDLPNADLSDLTFQFLKQGGRAPGSVLRPSKMMWT